MRNDRATTLTRSDAVLRLCLEGKGFSEIRQHADQEGRCVTARTLFRYIAQGDQLLADMLAQDRKGLFARHLAQRRMLYGKALDAGNYRAALEIFKDEAELCGLYGLPHDETLDHIQERIESLEPVRHIDAFCCKFGLIRFPGSVCPARAKGKSQGRLRCPGSPSDSPASSPSHTEEPKSAGPLRRRTERFLLPCHGEEGATQRRGAMPMRRSRCRSPRRAGTCCCCPARGC